MKRILLCGAVLAIAACGNPGPSQDAPSSSSNVDAASLPAASPVAEEASAPPVRLPSPSTPPARLTQQTRIQTTVATSDKPRQPQRIYTPAAGSPERVELMNALRLQVRNDLGGDPVFVVQHLRSNGQWAFAQLEPQWRDGRAIDLTKTPIYRENPDFPIDGVRTEVIWRKEGPRWQVYAHAIGATDVWWVEHCEILRGLANGC